MKKLAIISMILFTISTGTFAQKIGSKYTPEERATMQTAWMKENLSLTNEQLKEIEPLNLEYALKMEDVKSIQGKVQKLNEAKSISAEKDEKLKKILTKDQFDFYLKNRKELRKKIKNATKEEK